MSQQQVSKGVFFIFYFTMNEHLSYPIQMFSACCSSPAPLQRGGPDIHYMAQVVGVTPVVLVSPGDVSDGTIACVPEEMPGFI